MPGSASAGCLRTPSIAQAADGFPVCSDSAGILLPAVLMQKIAPNRHKCLCRIAVHGYDRQSPCWTGWAGSAWICAGRGRLPLLCPGEQKHREWSRHRRTGLFRPVLQNAANHFWGWNLPASALHACNVPEGRMRIRGSCSCTAFEWTCQGACKSGQR